MEFAELRIFQAVAEEGSLVRAAERLNRVPSNLSTRLRQLEDKLGVELFLRERQRLHLTAAGHRLLDYAHRLFALADEARSAVQGGEPAGTFVLGSMFSTAAIHLPGLLARYHQRYPKVNLQVHSGPSGELVEGLLAGRLDAALVDGPAPDAALEGQPWFEERLVLITGLELGPVRSPADVAGRPVFGFRAGCSYRRYLDTWYAAAGVPSGPVMEIESYHSMLACVITGGVALMPESMLDSLPGRERVQRHPIQARFAQATTWLMWRKGREGANLRSWLELRESLQTDREAVALV
ncbi:MULTISPECIES: putrescine utilization regulator PtrR [Pseudomonas]|jgi:DNA-binding transcriptional LysR family regulator|uniref:putrescine utilization regulator PtrR n=1 Tax=Pseudomonas TaxID=286 RepID=UPI0002EE7FC1|nr:MULTISPECIES: LysR family transcriptional regulator [Pseudomonas]MCD4865743.1 LysR substrate-binding domain-containing protein [Pseudomonas sp. PLB05]MDC7829496.1 LysR substrate-binding domain-containing protein [Pseudomonas benzopyrenica]NRH40285.1 LysR family transcriptional regulator [Pseudomonas sp. MS15a(2019)]